MQELDEGHVRSKSKKSGAGSSSVFSLETFAHRKKSASGLYTRSRDHSGCMTVHILIRKSAKAFLNLNL